jgi:hypothetical protein
MSDGLKASSSCVTWLTVVAEYSLFFGDTVGIFWFSPELKGVVGDDFFY